MPIEALFGKVFLLITGASRGIGRQIAITFGSQLHEGSHILILARNLNALHEVARNIKTPQVTVDCVSMDLGKSTKVDFEEVILQSLRGINREAFDRVIIVHNVGTMEVTKLVNDMVDLNSWREYYDLNLFMPAVLNAVVMGVFGANKNAKKLIINVTSLFAIEATRGCGYYCSAKAARDMYFKVFALENPDVDVLSYAPGPVDTDMFHLLCKMHVNQEDKERFTEMLTTKSVLTTEQTVNRLVEVLSEHKYKSGDHLDYYDKRCKLYN